MTKDGNDRTKEYSIEDRIGRAALYEQLAEECAELAHACLKASRIIRRENPTPVTPEECGTMIVEEWSDVTLCAQELGLSSCNSIIKRKLNRWRERIEMIK